MDSRAPLDDDAPLSIIRTFLRQAAALGLPDAATPCVAPFAPVEPSPASPSSRPADAAWEPLPLACRLDGPRRLR